MALRCWKTINWRAYAILIIIIIVIIIIIIFWNIIIAFQLPLITER